MSFNAGTARYRLELDDTGVQAKLQGFTNGMTQASFAVNNANRPMGSLNSNFQKLNGTFAAGVSPLSSFNSQVGAMPQELNKAGNSLEKTGGKLNKVGEFFRGNKGLVFGFAGLTSAAAEAAGMMGMYGDAVAQNTEAQQNLAEVQADVNSTTQDIAAAEQDAAKAKKWLSMSTRNLMLSQMDQVFFGTMVISQLSQMNIKGGFVGKTFGKIASVFKEGGAATKVFGNGITAGSDALGGFAGKAGIASKALAFLGSTMGGLTVVGAAGALALALIISKMEEFKSKTKNILTPLKPVGPGGLFYSLKDQSIKELDEITMRTGLSTGQITMDWDGAVAKFTAMGGKFNAAGKIIITAQEKVFKMPPGFKEGSAVWISWMAEYRKRGESVEDITKRLTDAGMDYALAVKIANLADAEYLNNKKTIPGFIDKNRTALETWGDVVKKNGALEQEAFDIMREFHSVVDLSGLSYEQITEKLAMYISERILATAVTDEEKAHAEALVDVIMKQAGVIYPKLITKMKEKEAAQKLVNITLADGTVVLGTLDQANEHYIGTVDEQLQRARDLHGQEKLIQTTLADGTTVWATRDQIIEKHNGTVDEQLAKAREQVKQAITLNHVLADGTKVWGDQDTIIEARNGTVDEQLEKAREQGSVQIRLAEMHKKASESVQEEEFALEELANTYGITINGIRDIIKNKTDETTAIKEGLAAIIPWDAAMKDTNVQAGLMAQGSLDATLKLEQWTKGLVTGYAENQKFRAGVAATVQDLYPMVNTTELTTQQLQALAEKGFVPAAEKAAMFQQKMEDMKQGVGADILSGVIGATDKKGFKDAWKELDLGDIPKDLRDDFKDIMKDANKLNEEALELNTSIQGLGMSFDKLSPKKAQKWTGKLIDEFKEWGKQMGGHEEQLARNTKLTDFLSDANNHNTDTYVAWSDAMQDNNIDAAEKADILAQLAEDTGEVVEPTEKLNEAQQKIADNNTLARTINQVTTNLSIQARAVVQLNSNYETLGATYSKVFNENGPGDIPNQPPAMTGPLDPFGRGGGNNKWPQLRIGTGDEESDTPQPKPTVLQVDNTQAVQKIADVAGRINQLSTFKPVITLDNGTAVQKVADTAGRIKQLTTFKPIISLVNTMAVQKTADVAGRIKALSKLKPIINLDNSKAVQKVADVAGRIKAISKLNPHVTVSVGLSGAGAKYIGGKAKGYHGMITEPTLMLVGEQGPEMVNVTPKKDMNKRIDNTGTPTYSGGGSDRSTVHIHQHLLTREVVQVLNLEKGRLMSKYNR